MGLWRSLVQCGGATTGLAIATVTGDDRIMRLVFVPLMSAAILALVPQAGAASVNAAFNDAIEMLHRAMPGLGPEAHGVDVAAYRDALTSGRFSSRHWGGDIALDLVESSAPEGSCARFAAYVSLPPQQGNVRLTVCPQFSAEGTPALRRLTVLHEMVHVVAGPDECRAMAFAAQIEQLATGSFTPVDRYWQSNNCGASAFSLP